MPSTDDHINDNTHVVTPSQTPTRPKLRKVIFILRNKNKITK